MRRQRKFADSMRHVDEETRRLIAEDRLAQLEKDQAASAIDAIGVENDLWEPSDVSDTEGKVHQKRKSSIGGARGRLTVQSKGDSIATKGQRRNRRTIEMVLMDEPRSLPHRDTFISIEAPPASKVPSARPAFKLCSVCSYMAPYKCVRCGCSFCSLACNSIHRETKCLKFAD